MIMKEKIKQTMESLLAGILVLLIFFTEDHMSIIILALLYALVMLKKTETEEDNKTEIPKD